MRFIRFYPILLLSFLIVCNGLIAQNGTVVVEKSNEKVLIAGKVFFVHTVKKGETLFSIAKTYNSSVDEVIANNPSLNNDLQVGQTIRIPDNPAKSTQISTNEGEILHVVAAGQTIYKISRIYGIGVPDIEALNPEVKYDSLQINQVIKIPVGKKKTLNEDANNFSIHKVVEKETLYSLSKKYGISQEELIRFNDPFLNEGLKTGMDIKIPLSSSVLKEDSMSAPTKRVSQQVDPNCNPENLKIKYDSIHISLMLPFMSSGKKEQAGTKEEESNEIMQFRPSEEFDPLAVNFIEFYQGFMLAASELKRKGLYLNISVYDTEKGTESISSIFEKPAVKKSNLIFGPVYKEQIKIALDRMNHMNSILVSPVAQHDALIQKNVKLYQVNPGAHMELKKCIDYLLADTSKNIVVIYKTEAGDNSEEPYAMFNKMLQEKTEQTQARVKKLNVFNNDFSGLSNELDSLKDNIVFSPVNDEIFVTTMFGQLAARLLFYRIQAILLQDYLNFASTDLNYFYDLQAVYFTPFHTGFHAESTKNILKKYRLIYGTEPVRNSKYGFNYGLMGYNLAYYFISSYAYFGFEIANHSECLKKLPVTSKLSFEQLEGNEGFTNTHLQKVIFGKDYSLVIED